MNKIGMLALLVSLLVVNCEKAPEADKAKVEPAKTDAAPAAKGAPQKLNTQTSLIKWIGTKVTGKHNGEVKIKEGEVLVDNNKITGGKFVIDMATIEDKDLDGEWKEKLEKHLKDTDFFEVTKFPTAKFDITKVEEAENGKLTVTGNLEIKGVSKSISFPATVEKDETQKIKGAKANFNINRQEWGIVYKGKADDVIRDEINLDLDLKL